MDSEKIVPKNTVKEQIRYSIAELFGLPIDQLSIEERNRLLDYSISGKVKDYPACPFRLKSAAGENRCSKKGGVCSLRRYRNSEGKALRIDGFEGTPTITCPYRFHEALTVFNWIGEVVLNARSVSLVKEIGFLETSSGSIEETPEEATVGRIDMIIIDQDSLGNKHMDWCAIEIQAVYFSGPGMEEEFKNLRSYIDNGIPFPQKIRRPDFRSSAPKRLMPQLQIKVPTLRRWGKKMAIVVDRHFYNWMGKLETKPDISSSDIIWFVVDFEDNLNREKVTLIRGNEIHSMTLEKAIESLTGGEPVSLQSFEERIKSNIKNGISIIIGK